MLDPEARPTISNEKIPQIPPIPSVNKMFQKLSQRKKHYTTPVWVFNYRREGIINIEKLWALKMIWGLKMLFELRVFSFFRNHLWMCRMQTPRMLVWWIAGGKCPEMMKIVGILGIPWILLILSIYWLYYPASTHYLQRRKFQETQHTNEQICLSSRITGVIAFLVSCPLGENERQLATTDESFCARSLTHNLRTAATVCLFNVTDLISWWVNFIGLCVSK